MYHNKINLLELATRESDTIEWKENVADERKLVETIVAFTNDFLNLGGGYIVCGAKEIVDINGFKSVEYMGLTASNLEKLKKFVSDTCYNPTKVNPPIIPKFDEVDLPNDPTKRVLVITVDATTNAHTYKADNDNRPRHFARTDSNTRAATNGIERELLRRKGQLEPWDRRLNLKATIEDIDVLILRQYLQTMRLWSPNKTITDYLSDKEKIEQFIPPLLGSSGIDKPQYPKNFTLMVFGEKPIDFCVGAYSIFTLFEGKNKGKQQAETQWITGTIVEQANKLIELLNIESTVAIDKSAENVNQIKYPKIALKEAIVNAIVHRDYEIDQPTRVEVYSDRVEIYSPGGLTHDVDKNKFKEGNAKASWRNQSFARIFDRLNLAQHQGSGIGKIINSMQEEGCPMPIFEVDNDSITCILPAHPRHRIMRQLSEAESNIVIRNYLSAYKQINEILHEDVYNYRALELFCEVNNLLDSPKNVLDLLLTKSIDFSLIRSNTLVVISESLSLMKDNKKAETLSKELLMIASSRRLEEKQLIKIAFTLKKLGDDKAVVDFVNITLHQYPNLSTNTFLLDQKGRALIDLAKRCEDTFNDSQATHRIKNKAKEDFETYIKEAQKALSVAYENSESIIDKDYIEKALSYIKTKMRSFLAESPKNTPDARTLYVHKIPSTVSEEEVRDTYSKYGEIEKINLHLSDKNIKYAYIRYFEIEGAYRAYLDKDNLSLGGVSVYTEPYKTNK